MKLDNKKGEFAIKAIGSKINILDYHDSVAVEFYDCIGDLIHQKAIKRLDRYDQHMGTTRLQHSLNVAYYSFLMAKSLGLDFRAAARGGLMHDLFFYDYHVKPLGAFAHSSVHSRLALKNAKRLTALSKKEEDIIKKHMWPMTLIPPRYLESYVVTFADKCCACSEIIYKIVKDMKVKFIRL